ncbi:MULTISPECIES: GNAT family N-acetyltransferase [unclassified Streptomyces]|uniref:GNAT family N-acetyltransferase n=1 Tax=unclassified Streptomyces TaxID=2593676 RepID=UPI0013695B9D|nr:MULTISPECIES: GNAT family N-acetyltransferase [unclassified Streptomyces]NEA05682.1 GNAT family N-acetyltransferase [Streptomyces sp. SID10116]MYY80274.1 GNAT family N-acetyltransferase [Streptomyces sp. SID335]MYZ16124.1 GNAT family N-acetyltransferase [Streptomyces sp. SID337]NDZ90138.1 GNAT family N-acetyltransferase [Streptomyces sp. SID10115]NEB46750.1 GNAT family N-acetyltransferase [Streptomyces sp. SID339]
MSTSHPTPHRIRPLIDEDVPVAVNTLARAFADYPFTRHVVADDDHDRRVRRFQELFLTRIGMVYGRVWVAGAGRAVAVWTTPDRDPGPGFAAIGPLIGELAGDRAPWFESADHALRPHRPQFPAWFLATVGVDPDEQGKGLGRAVLEPGLEAADRAGFPCFLETSTEQNVAFYERLGFTVTADVPLPGDGPRTWCMLRKPA